jgi:hydrogenase nickel incorporation protein HypA/HybF
MHELSIAMALVEQVQTVAEREKADAVLRVSVTIGGLSGVNPEALEMAFPIAAENTCAAGARLEVTFTPARVHCRSCGRESSPEFPILVCEACGSTDAEILGGRELMLTTVEIDKAEG